MKIVRVEGSVCTQSHAETRTNKIFIFVSGSGILQSNTFFIIRNANQPTHLSLKCVARKTKWAKNCLRDEVRF